MKIPPLVTAMLTMLSKFKDHPYFRNSFAETLLFLGLAFRFQIHLQTVLK